MGLVSRLKSRGMALLERVGADAGAERRGGKLSGFDTDADLFGRAVDITGPGLPVLDLTQRLHDEDRERMLACFEEARRGRDMQGAYRVAGGGRWIRLDMRSLRDEAGEPNGVSITGQAVPQRWPGEVAADGEGSPELWVDSAARLDALWSEARLHRAPVSLVVAEIAAQAALERRFGGPELRRLARGMEQAALRAVGPAGLALRYDATALVLVLPNCSMTVARAIAMRFSADTLSHAENDLRNAGPSLSLGCGIADALTLGADDLLQAGLAALATAGAQGTNRLACVDLRRPGMTASAAAA